MKNKKAFRLSVLFCSAMLMIGCGQSNQSSKTDGSSGADTTYYTVTFMNEGTVYDTKQAEANDVVARPATDPSKDGHQFVGWYTSETEGQQWVFETDVVTEDMSLYSRFEANQVDYTVNLLLDGVVKDSKTTNSKDKGDVTLSAVAVGDGKALLGYGRTAGTTVDAVEYRVGSKLTYEQVVALADNNHVVNLNAVVKTGEMIRLNVGVWGKYVDEKGFQRIFGAYKTYLNTANVAYDFLDYTFFADASNVAGCVAEFKKDSYSVIFPSINNFKNDSYISPLVKKHASVGTIVWDQEGKSETGRCVTTFVEDVITNNFYDWILSEAGKKALDPSYEPSTEHGEASATKFYIGVWGRYYTKAESDNLVAEFKKYLTALSISYEAADVVYLTGDQSVTPNYYNKAPYLTEITNDLTVDIIFPVNEAIATGTDGDIPTKLKAKISHPLNLGTGEGGLGLTIGGQTNRYLAALNEDALTLAFITFCQTEDGKKALDATYGEAEDPEVVQTTLIVSFYGRFIPQAASTKILDALKAYFTAQNISYTSVTPDYVTKAKGSTNEEYVNEMNPNADVSIGGKSSSNSPVFAKPVIKNVSIGAIKDEGGTSRSDRGCFTFVNGNLCNATVDFFATATWTALLAEINA